MEDSAEIDRDPPIFHQLETASIRITAGMPSMGTNAALGKPATVPADVRTAPMEPLDETGDPTLHAVQAVIGCSAHASDGDIGHVEDFLVSGPD